MSWRFLLHDPHYWLAFFFDHYSFPFLTLTGWAAGMLLYSWLTASAWNKRDRLWYLSIHFGTLFALAGAGFALIIQTTPLLDMSVGQLALVFAAPLATLILLLTTTMTVRRLEYFPSTENAATVGVILIAPLFVFAYKHVGQSEMLAWMELIAAQEKSPAICSSLKGADRFACEEELATDGQLNETECRNLASLDNQILCLSRLPASTSVCGSMDNVLRFAIGEFNDHDTASTAVDSCFERLRSAF